MAKNNVRVGKIKRRQENRRLQKSLVGSNADRRFASKMRRFERSPAGKNLGTNKAGQPIIGRRTEPVKKVIS